MKPESRRSTTLKNQGQEQVHYKVHTVVSCTNVILSLQCFLHCPQLKVGKQYWEKWKCPEKRCKLYSVHCNIGPRTLSLSVLCIGGIIVLSRYMRHECNQREKSIIFNCNSFVGRWNILRTSEKTTPRRVNGLNRKMKIA